MGVDYPRVAASLHVGAPTSAIDFAQEVGQLEHGNSELVPFTVVLRFRLSFSPLQPTSPAWSLVREKDREDVPVWLGAKQQRRLAIDDGRAPASDVDSDDKSRSNDDFPGPEVLRQHVRDEARGRERYLQLLEDFHGCCMICRLLGSGGHGMNVIWHDLDQCRHRRKRDFFTAKNAIVKASKQNNGWLAAYAALYGCGNPQEVCQIQGARGCQFRDLVSPTLWAFFHTVRPFGKSLEQWTGRAFDTETVWTKWLGQEREVYGMRATNAMWTTDQVLGELRRA